MPKICHFLPSQQTIEYSVFSNNLGMYNNNTNIWHMHDTFEFALYLSNTLCVRNGSLSVELKGPCLLVHRPYSLHYIRPLRPEVYTRHILNFDPDFCPAGEEYGLVPNILFPDDFHSFSLDETQVKRFIPLFTAFSDRANEHLFPFLFLALLAELRSLPSVAPAQAPTFRPMYVCDVIRFLRERYSEPLTVPELARRFNVSPTKLNKDFQSFVHCSVHEMLIRLRLHAAAKLLLTEPSITSVALQCGFSSESHFIRTFKSFYYITPLQYAKSTRR